MGLGAGSGGPSRAWPGNGKGRRIVELALQGPRMFEKSVWKRPAGGGLGWNPWDGAADLPHLGFLPSGVSTTQ